jgi:hypothetical protein
MRKRRRFRDGDAIRSIRLRGGFASIADGFATLGGGMGSLMGDTPIDDSSGGRWVHRNKPLHPCVLPDLEDASVGEVWQCGTCGSMWIATHSHNGDPLVMVRTNAPTLWSTATNGYGYTYTSSTPTWYSYREERRGGDSDG